MTVPPSTASAGVQISVSYQFFITGQASELKDQAALADVGRRQVYRMLAQECQVLLETIASTCAIERANVNSQITRQRPNMDGARVTGSATYKIELKPNPKVAEKDATSTVSQPK